MIGLVDIRRWVGLERIADENIEALTFTEDRSSIAQDWSCRSFPCPVQYLRCETLKTVQEHAY